MGNEIEGEWESIIEQCTEFSFWPLIHPTAFSFNALSTYKLS